MSQIAAWACGRRQGTSTSRGFVGQHTERAEFPAAGHSKGQRQAEKRREVARLKLQTKDQFASLQQRAEDAESLAAEQSNEIARLSQALRQSQEAGRNAGDAATAAEDRAAALSGEIAQLQKHLEERHVTLPHRAGEADSRVAEQPGECARLSQALRESHEAESRARVAAKAAEYKVDSLTGEIAQLRKDLEAGHASLRQRAEEAESRAAEQSAECARLSQAHRQAQEAERVAEEAAKAAGDKLTMLTVETAQLREHTDGEHASLRKCAEEAESLASEHSAECARLSLVLRQSQEAESTAGEAAKAAEDKVVALTGEIAQLKADLEGGRASLQQVELLAAERSCELSRLSDVRQRMDEAAGTDGRPHLAASGYVDAAGQEVGALTEAETPRTGLEDERALLQQPAERVALLASDLADVSQQTQETEENDEGDRTAANGFVEAAGREVAALNEDEQPRAGLEDGRALLQQPAERVALLASKQAHVSQQTQETENDDEGGHTAANGFVKAAEQEVAALNEAEQPNAGLRDERASLQQPAELVALLASELAHVSQQAQEPENDDEGGRAAANGFSEAAGEEVAALSEAEQPGTVVEKERASMQQPAEQLASLASEHADVSQQTQEAAALTEDEWSRIANVLRAKMKNGVAHVAAAGDVAATEEKGDALAEVDELLMAGLEAQRESLQPRANHVDPPAAERPSEGPSLASVLNQPQETDNEDEGASAAAGGGVVAAEQEAVASSEGEQLRAGLEVERASLLQLAEPAGPPAFERSDERPRLADVLQEMQEMPNPDGVIPAAGDGVAEVAEQEVAALTEDEWSRIAEAVSAEMKAGAAHIAADGDVEVPEHEMAALSHFEQLRADLESECASLQHRAKESEVADVLQQTRETETDEDGAQTDADGVVKAAEQEVVAVSEAGQLGAGFDDARASPQHLLDQAGASASEHPSFWSRIAIVLGVGTEDWAANAAAGDGMVASEQAVAELSDAAQLRAGSEDERTTLHPPAKQVDSPAAVPLGERSELSDVLQQTQEAEKRNERPHDATNAGEGALQQEVPALSEVETGLEDEGASLQPPVEQAGSLASEQSSVWSRLAEVLGAGTTDGAADAASAGDAEAAEQETAAHIDVEQPRTRLEDGPAAPQPPAGRARRGTGTERQAGLPRGVQAEAQVRRLAEDASPLVGRQVALHSRLHNRFVCVLGTGTLPVGASAAMGTDSPPGPWERFTVVDAGDGAISLLSLPGHSFVVMLDGFVVSFSKGLLDERDDLAPGRRFTIVDAGGGAIALHNAAHNRFVRMRDNHRLYRSENMNKDDLPPASGEERFTLVVFLD